MIDDRRTMARTFRLGFGLAPPRKGEDWTDAAVRGLRTGRGPIVPRFVYRLGPQAAGRVLDFGAGAAALQTRALLRLGFNVDGYDSPSSRDDLESDDVELRRRAELYFLAVDDEVLVEELEVAYYDLAFASNVLNVQTSRARLRSTLLEVRTALRPGGVFVANLPENPRVALTTGRRGERELEGELRGAFGEVRRLEGAVAAGEELGFEDDRRTESKLWVCR